MRSDHTSAKWFRLSRRAAIGGAFAGYAVAAIGAEATPIHTDEAGLATGMVDLASGIPPYLARPARKGRFPAILVIQEAFGLHEYIRDVCRRLAKLGYVVIAPQFYYRTGDTAELPDIPSVMKIVHATPDNQVLSDMRSAIAYLKARKFIDAKRIGATGFCWGGRWAWLAAAMLPEVRASVAWYGQMLYTPGAPAGPDQFQPIDFVTKLRAPVLGLYGGKDRLAETIPAMRQAIAAAGRHDEIVLYPDAPHGFHADYRGQFYNEAAAKDGWLRMISHFRRNGVGPARS